MFYKTHKQIPYLVTYFPLSVIKIRNAQKTVRPIAKEIKGYILATFKGRKCAFHLSRWDLYHRSGMECGSVNQRTCNRTISRHKGQYSVRWPDRMSPFRLFFSRFPGISTRKRCPEWLMGKGFTLCVSDGGVRPDLFDSTRLEIVCGMKLGNKSVVTHFLTYYATHLNNAPFLNAQLRNQMQHRSVDVKNNRFGSIDQKIPTTMEEFRSFCSLYLLYTYY